MEVVEHRSRYYEFLVKAVLKSLGVPEQDIHVKRESSYCLTEEYSKDKMKLCAVSTWNELVLAGSEVRRATVLSPLLCPAHQALNDFYLGSDFQIGGLDQASQTSMPATHGLD